MATGGRIPKPYQNDVPEEGEERVMEYTTFKTMGIGARRSGLPKDASQGPKSLDHVGGTTDKRGGK